MIYEKKFVLNDDELTDELLIGFINEHKSLNLRYEELERMYKSDHDILYEDEKPDYKPDNRLVVNFAKYIVDTFNGYFMGIPVKTSHSNKKVSDFIQFLEAYNNLDDNNAELSKKCDIYGHAYELIYYDENSQIGITGVDPREAFLIYDNSIRERVLYGIRYKEDKLKEINGSISDANKIRYFRIKDGKVIYEEEKPNVFGEVPIVEYVENEERQGAFEPVELLINAYNKAISEKANDVDYFADAYMKILGAELKIEDLLDIKRNRIINLANFDDSKITVEFMEKPNADKTQENLIDRMEKLIFTIAMVANINDENFGTSSGIALKYKLQSMSNLANTKERKFVKGMNKRFSIIANAPTSKITKDDLVDLTYQFTRNIPSNLLEEAQTAQQLVDIVSDETVLKTLSVVDNVQEELDKIKEQDSPIVEYDHERFEEDRT